MKDSIFILLLFLFSGFTQAQLKLPAKEYKAPKYKAFVNLNNGIELKGIVLSGNEKNVVLAGFYYRDEVYRYFNKLDTIPIDSIYNIIFRERYNGLRGAWGGFKLGMIYGMLQGSIIFFSTDNNAEGFIFAGIYMLSAGLAGAAFGAVFNPFLSDKTIGGKYPFDYYEINKLQKRAYLDPKAKNIRFWFRKTQKWNKN